VTDANLSQVEGGQGREKSQEALILMEERKNATNSRKRVVGVDRMMK
jgi:hypothetical protein